jgi:uncharacterized protein (DUF58 family)
VGLAALNTGNNLLYLVLALMLSFLVLSGVLSESALRGIAVRRRLPRELYAGASSTVALEIANLQRRVAAFAVVVEDVLCEGEQGERSAGRVFALRIAPGGVVTRGYRLEPSRRGSLKFVRFQASTRFPFGLFSKSLELECGDQCLVYPAVEPLWVPPGFGRAPAGSGSAPGAGGEGCEAAGLRRFAAGDPARRIHWRSSLRRGELLVRDVERAHEAPVEVRLRTSGAEPGEFFERGVRRAASEAVALLDAGLRVALRTDSTLLAADAGSGHRARLLAFLARVEPEPRRAAEAV